MCLFFSVQGTSTLGMDSDVNQQTESFREAGIMKKHYQGAEASKAAKSSPEDSKGFNDTERQIPLRPGDAGKKGVTSIFGGHRTSPAGAAASRNKAVGVQ